MTDGPVTPEALATGIAELRDLFLRRLLEDRAKQQLYDRLYAELEFTRTDLVRQFIAPLCREMLLIIDRIEAASQNDDPRTVLGSIFDELTEIMSRRGVTPVVSVGLAFDPHVHEAVELVAVDRPDDDGLILGERRRGYRMDDQLLRPAQVIVGRYDIATAG